MPTLPERPSLEHLRKQAKRRGRARGIPLSQAQHELANAYGFASWPRLVHRVRAEGLPAFERALVLADDTTLAGLLRAAPSTAIAPINGGPPLLALLTDSIGTPAGVRACAGLLLDAGADPDARTGADRHGGSMSALSASVRRGDTALTRLLVERGATRDDDAFYHACEHADTDLLDLLYAPGFERMVNHKLDAEDAAGLRWFLDHGTDVNAECCLHHAIARGRGVPILTMLLDAGAQVDRPWDRWDTGRRPLALAARCGHLAAYELLAARGATAELDAVDAAVLAIARGESTVLPDAPPPALGIPGDGYGWILSQFAALGRTEIVGALLDDGTPVGTRGWSGFTPLHQAAMNGRPGTVRLLLDRGGDVHDGAFDATGPTPLDCAIWGLRNSRAADGDYPGTVEALLAAGAPTGHEPPTGDDRVDALLRAPRFRGPRRP